MRLQVLLLAAALVAIPARAEHFDMSLRLTGRSGSAQTGWDTSPPVSGFNPIPVFHAEVGEELQLEWRLRSEFPHGVMKRVVVRLRVAPVGPADRRTGPGRPAVLDNEFTADFQPHHAARGSVRFRTPLAGRYQVRLQSEMTQKGHGHEHFAAIDLRVAAAGEDVRR